MLRRVNELRNYTMGASDGDIGKIDDVYFDDQGWTVRHLVVDTGHWLPGRRVLIPPRAIERIDPTTQRLMTNLRMRQVEDSPGIDSAKPVSRQYEQDLYGYYGYPFYWGGPYLWGPIIYPTAPPPESYEAERLASDRPSGDTHLRSARDVSGHGIQATDGELGHVEDFLIDEQTWAIRYLVVDPRNWWPGHFVVISTEWIIAVHWNDSTVQVDVDKETVRNAPGFDPTAAALDRDYENRLHDHFRRPGYWERGPESWKRYPPAA
jgi:sporulation protein YlmC with PRC-barrel domain